MYINSIKHYIPEGRISNDAFFELNGLTDEWIYKRTGIKTRSIAEKDENTNTLAIKVAKLIAAETDNNLQSVDLIIGGTYSPFDTVGTLAHAIQREFDISKAIVISVSTACSTFVNAVEIVEGYFATGKAKKALIVVSEKNSDYHNPTDDKAGHLWGDGAAGILVSKDRESENDMLIKDSISYGHANEGYGNEGVVLRPRNGGIQMPNGKDVFIHAVSHMRKRVEEILEKNDLGLNDLDFMSPHQANIRIIDNVAENLGLDKSKVFTNIEECGNTGCPSSLIALSQNIEKVKKGNRVVISVFGGGYSSGAVLIEA